MCTIKSKYPKKSFTGYKIVNIKDGRFFSVVTGVEYIAGKKVTPMTIDEVAEDFSSTWDFINILDPEGKFFDKRMTGKTGVFMHRKDAERNLFNIGPTLVEMTISGNMYEGDTGYFPVVIGDFIESITLLED